MTIGDLPKFSASLHDDGDALEGFWGRSMIFRYVYRPELPEVESPKPYFHPLYSLGGAMLTDFRPIDHPWHHGLSMTLTLVGGHNFWGGPTYRQEDGYVYRSDHGSQNHVGWSMKTHDQSHIGLKQMLDWRSCDGKSLICEERRMEFDFSLADAGWYTLGFATCLRNVSGRDLRLDTYASASGLAGSPYTGLQFRGRRGFLDSQHGFTPRVCANGWFREVSEVHGQRWSWVAICGKNVSEAEATVIFCDNPRNPRYPNVFFLREDNAQVAFSFVGDRPVMLDTGASIDLRYQIAIGSGVWGPDAIRERAESLIGSND